MANLGAIRDLAKKQPRPGVVPRETLVEQPTSLGTGEQLLTGSPRPNLSPLKRAAGAGQQAVAGAVGAGAAGLGGLSQRLGQFVQGNPRVSQGFGNINSLYAGATAGARHLGIDFATPEGTGVFAPFSGEARAGHDPGGWGSYVEVKDPKTGISVRFSHLSQLAQAVMKGQVQAGQQVGLTGGVPGTRGAGRTTGAHLDVSARNRQGQVVDPRSIQPIRRQLQGGG